MHPHIEKYLAQVSRQLNNLSVAQRHEEVRELGQHLQSLVDEGRGRGLSESAAVKAALSQFGSYRKVGRDLNNAVLRAAPQRLSKAFSAMTFVLMGQAVLALLVFGVLVVPTNWAAYLSAHGGIGGAIWQISQALLFCVFTVQLALVLRQVRPWALWTALALLGYKGIFGALNLFRILSWLCQQKDPSWFQIGFFTVNEIVFYFPTLFCLWVLLSNRKSYLHLARTQRSA